MHGATVKINVSEVSSSETTVLSRRTVFHWVSSVFTAWSRLLL